MKFKAPMTEDERKAKARSYYEKNTMALRMYHYMRRYAFGGERTGRRWRGPVLTQEERHVGYVARYRAYNRAMSDRRAAARSAESGRVRRLFAPAWPALVGLIAAAYREELDAHNARKKRQRSAKPDHYRAYHKQYSEKNREKLRAGRVDWNRRTRYEARRTAEDIANVSPRYVVKKLLDGTALKARDLPPALIEAKRQQLLLRRAIQQKTQT